MNKIVKIGFPMEYEDDKHIIRTGMWLKEYEVEMLEKKLNEYNHLQSKIDKAIEYIENNLLPSHNIEKTDWEFEEVIFSDLPVERIKPLIDILKEVENVENN